MIKICFVINDIKIGGTQKLTIDTINLLNLSNQFNIELLCLSKPDGEPTLRNLLHNGIKIRFVDTMGNTFIRRIYSLSKIFKQYDLIHSSMETSNLYSSLAKFLTSRKTKFINTTHGTDGIYIEDKNLIKIYNGAGFKNRFMHTFVQNLAFKFYKLFIAVSIDTKEYLVKKRKINPSIIEVVYHGLNLKDLNNSTKCERAKMRKEYNLSEKDFVIGYVGRLTYAKGLEYLIDEFPKIITENKHIKLLLIGDGELRKELEYIVNKKSLSSSCIFTGTKNNVSEYFDLMDLFLLPSFSESTNLGLLQAMYQENICLTSDCGGLKEVITDGMNGFFFKTGDFEEMRAKIKYIYDNYNQLDQIRENAKRTVEERFDLSKNILKIQEAILNLV